MMFLFRLVLIAFAFAAGFGIARTLDTPDHLMPLAGSFQPCPDRPSCVSSVEQRAKRKIAPIAYTGDAQAALVLLRKVIALTGGKIQRDDDNGYVHALYETPTVGFRDDVEFLQRKDARVFEVRSVSRFGYRDFDANRDRVEKIRSSYQEVAGR